MAAWETSAKPNNEREDRYTHGKGRDSCRHRGRGAGSKGQWGRSWSPLFTPLHPHHVLTLLAALLGKASPCFRHLAPGVVVRMKACQQGPEHSKCSADVAGNMGAHQEAQRGEGLLWSQSPSPLPSAGKRKPKQEVPGPRSHRVRRAEWELGGTWGSPNPHCVLARS